MMIQSFVDLAFYNGHYEECKKLYEYIKNCDDEYVIGFPDFLEEYDHDDFIRVFWSILVLKYGDYGTSPRFGWLEKDNGDKLIAEFEKAFNYFEEVELWNTRD